MPGIGAQVVPLVVALGLSMLIGIEREVRHKVAGLRTHALVGIGSALLMLVSKYGFNDILDPGRVVSNPGQMAGQVITGIGFLGGGIIFVRRESARGVITAASIWVVAAIGMAAGAGLYVLAVAGTIADLLILLGFTPITERLRQADEAVGDLALTYRQGTGVLRQAMTELTDAGCTIEALNVVPATGTDVCVVLEVRSHTKIVDLVTNLAQIPGVVTVRGDHRLRSTTDH